MHSGEAAALCTWEMSNWCACLPWECLSSCPFFWGWAGVRRCLCLKILEHVLSLSSLLISDFYHFSLLVPAQLSTKLVCHLPAVLTCCCCFPEKTKLLGFCSTRCWMLRSFYLCFLAQFALGAFKLWLGLSFSFLVQAWPYPHAALHPHALPTEELRKQRSKRIFYRH